MALRQVNRLGLCAQVASLAVLWGGLSAQENTGTVSQPLVGGALVDAVTQERFALLTLSDGSGSCSASLLNNHWAITAAHCVEVEDAAGNPISDPARPQQFVTMAPESVSLSAAWGAKQQRAAVQIETFRPYDVAIIRVAAPFRVHNRTAGYKRAIFSGKLVDVPIMVYGRGIHQFAQGTGVTATKSLRDGQFRSGTARTSREDGNLFWFSPKNGQMIAGGDSGGPSFVKVGVNLYALIGVHSDSTVTCLPGMPCGDWTGPGPKPAGYNPWDWVASTPEAADAPIGPLWEGMIPLVGDLSVRSVARAKLSITSEISVRRQVLRSPSPSLRSSLTGLLR